ncbi:MAG: FAD-dependent oxidoreductase [Candidatus Obscuribacterales bacterium]|nr:FAD-dependent oxidoreductase [Candidatus Obscuribacterales bacterium]
MTTLNQAHWNDTVSVEVAQILQLPNFSSEDYAGNVVYDVAIVGGGIAGLSAALSAAQNGASVILLEKGAHLGSGASGRNAGILGAGVNMPITSMPQGHPAVSLWQSTSALVHEIYEEAKHTDSLLKTKQVGAYSFATSKAAVERLKAEAKARNSFNLEAEVVAPDVVQRLTGDKIDLNSVQAALWLEDEGRINPLTLLAQRARQAKQLGVRFSGHAKVEKFSVVANLWQLSVIDPRSEIAKKQHLDVVKAKSLIIATGPIEEANARIYAISFAVDLPDNFPLFWDAAPFVYYDYRYGDGHLTVSGGRYGKAGVSKNDGNYHRKMIEAAREWLPCLKNTLPTYAWAVDLNVTNDMIPEINYFSNELYGAKVAGLGALGVLPGMVLGARAGIEAVQKSSRKA